MKHRSDSSLDIVLDDDAFIDALAQGVDPSEGDDALASLLLNLREDVVAPMPPAPTLEELGLSSLGTLDGFAEAEDPHAAAAAPVTTEIPVVADTAARTAAAPAATAAEDELASRRQRRNHRAAQPRRRVSAFVSGLVGAAAATLVIAGGGVAVYNAEPGSPLWGMNTALFGDHAAVVELATTLEEADTRSNEGDIEGARKLLEQARAMANEINSNAAKKGKDPVAVPEPSTTTVTERATTTETVVAPPEQQPTPAEPTAPATVTTTVTVVQVPGEPTESTVAPTTTPVPVPEVLDPPTLQQQPEGASPIANNATQPTAPVSIDEASATPSAHTAPNTAVKD